MCPVNSILVGSIFLVFAFSCNSPEISKSDKKLKPGNQIFQEQEYFSNTLDYLKIAADFAEKFNPTPTKERVVQNLDNVSDTVVKAFKYLRKKSILKSEEYLTIIFLKLYKSHLECCHQSYELRANILPAGNIDSIADPLLYEFNLITNYFDNNRRIEFISSGIAYSWVENNKRLLENTAIKKKFEEIKKISKKIKKGVYWK